MKNLYVKTISGYNWTGKCAGYKVLPSGTLLILPTEEAASADALFVAGPNQWEFIELIDDQDNEEGDE